MKLAVSFLLVLLSILLAYLKTSELRHNVKNSLLLVKLSEKIKNNIGGEMRSLLSLSEEFFNESSPFALAFTSTDILMNYLNTEFSALPYISEYVNELSKIPVLSSDELYGCSKKLIEIAEKGCDEISLRYKNDSKNAYILFPGIISVFILILL